MEGLLNQFVDWMIALPAVWAYSLLFLIAWGENVVPAIPGDLLIVFCGYLAGTGQLGLGPVILIATVGGAVGFMTMFALGHRMGGAILDPQRFRWLPKKLILRTQKWLKRWGFWIVAVNRFLSGARSVIAITVGMARMDTAKTTLVSAFGAFVWTALITYAGYTVGDNWQVVGVYLRQYGKVIVSLMLLGGAAWLFLRWRRLRAEHRAVQKSDETS